VEHVAQHFILLSNSDGRRATHGKKMGGRRPTTWVSARLRYPVFNHE
jgi:hypothetical protein